MFDLKIALTVLTAVTAAHNYWTLQSVCDADEANVLLISILNIFSRTDKTVKGSRTTNSKLYSSISLLFTIGLTLISRTSQ